ncbi:hypothetical protein CEUSTIGMA_g9472.t1 [Chlamydomonas eustigma]|uniref:Protein kinase domain-containing protein n=1 Tax=Chlamydomonas eustigma TaxID=1157962 RepID=A0A250XG40_9CHLO|nr:hypothetical protein CEUSTIGMA_g9472.t1 [Chlamydomonas eustigma]|eukprot:GAX82044.1 hypothetical protein CEUSTIGMA_g9472.t1 [Chlamydomonas eustigma]
MVLVFFVIAVLVKAVDSLYLFSNISITGEAFSQHSLKPVSVSYSGDVIIGSENLRYDIDFNYSFGAHSLLQGSRVTFVNLQISNVTFSQSNSSLLLPTSFSLSSGARLFFQNVSFTTTCNNILFMRNALGVQQAIPQSLHLEKWSSDQVFASNVTFSCSVPPYQRLQQLDSQPSYLINSAVDWLNALVDAQNFTNRTEALLVLQNNISWSQLYSTQQSVQRWTITINITLQGLPNNLTVVDWNTVNWVFGMHGNSALLTFNNLTFLNLSPLRGLIVADLGYLPLFAIPFWPVWPRVADDIIFNNVTFVLSQNEYSYMVLLVAGSTSQVPAVQESVDALRANFEFQLPPLAQQSHNPAYLKLSVFDGNGINATSFWMTSWPPTGFTLLQPQTNTPSLSLSSYPKVTQVGCYSDEELMSLLSSLQSTPLDAGIAIILYADISLQSANWPQNGYTLNNSVYFVGGFGKDMPTVLDFQLLPHFITLPSLIGSSPQFIMYLDMILVNLAAGPASQPSIALTFMNSVVQVINSTVVIPYADMVTLFNTVEDVAGQSGQIFPDLVNAQIAGPASIASGILLSTASYGAHISYLDINFTYKLPASSPNLSLLYNNSVFPPPAPPIPGAFASSSISQLSNGSIIGISVACGAVGIVGIAAFIVFLLLRDKRREYAHTHPGEAEMGLKSGYQSGQNSSQQKVHSNYRQHATLAEARLASCEHAPSGQGSDQSYTQDQDSRKLPEEELRLVSAALAAEINDEHLVILDVLGQGGFGTVYRGCWKGIVVAVKTITFQDKLVGGDKGQHTAIMEAAISSSMAHPGLVATYTYEVKPMKVDGIDMKSSPAMVTDWKLYMVQEYCDAGSLRQAILKFKFLDVRGVLPRMDLILTSALELASGLAHLHSKNIIHGDLNPNNVLLKSDRNSNRGFVCKLADFGLSVKMQAGQSHISNMRRGTPFYTAPEVLSKGNMTKAADTFSYGVMLWEMLHSMMCYKITPEKTFEARAIFPSFPRQCHQGYAALSTACMSHDPLERPTMHDVTNMVKGMLLELKEGRL